MWKLSVVQKGVLSYTTKTCFSPHTLRYTHTNIHTFSSPKNPITVRYFPNDFSEKAKSTHAYHLSLSHSCVVEFVRTDVYFVRAIQTVEIVDVDVFLYSKNIYINQTISLCCIFKYNKFKVATISQILILNLHMK